MDVGLSGISAKTRTGAIPALVVACLAAPGCRAAEVACPPAHQMPHYDAGEPTLRAYGVARFAVPRSGEVMVAGALCRVMYTVQAGEPPATNADIQARYRDELAHADAQFMATDDRDTVARVFHDRKESWISVDSQESEIVVTVVTKQDPKPTLTEPDATDYRLLGHMPDYVAQKAAAKPLTEDVFDVQAGDEPQTVKAQGKTVEVSYAVRPGAPVASDAEIQFNYRAALKRLGAEILRADDHSTDARLIDNGRTIWIKLYSHETGIDLAAVEENAEQSGTPPSADDLAAALDGTGRATLRLDFDLTKAALKPDARAAIGEVVALLRKDRTLRLSVEGHTEDVGDPQANMDLSQRRADAVVQALVGRGIDGARLTAQGFGATRPIASNLTSQGRAQNVRIELVKQ